MWHVVVWALVAMLAAPWTLACMGLHWLLSGPDWSVGDTDTWLRWLERWQIPVWLADWLPMASVTALKAWLTALGPWVESLLAQAPALLTWLVPLLWIAWGLGLLVLVMLGVAGSVLVVALRRPAPPRPA
jgi:hypothetical protein